MPRRGDEFGTFPPWQDDSLPLAERTRRALKVFDADTKGYAYDDSGEGTIAATWFADLLDEWMALVPWIIDKVTEEYAREKGLIWPARLADHLREVPTGDHPEPRG